MKNATVGWIVMAWIVVTMVLSIYVTPYLLGVILMLSLLCVIETAGLFWNLKLMGGK